MKTKHFFFLVALVSAFVLTGCYNDDKLWDAVDTQRQHLDALEAWQKTATDNIRALQTLVNTHDYVTGLQPVVSAGDTIGYTLTFLHSAPVTLLNGATGPDGDKGDTGPAGTPGTPGTDGATPIVSLTHADDGNWYWTLNGTLLTDAAGQPIRANGPQGPAGPTGPTGPTGDPGADGTPAITPLVRTGEQLDPDALPAGEWFADALYLSVDNGATWTRITHQDGADRWVWRCHSSGDYFEIELNDGHGSRLTLPLYKEFALTFSIGDAALDPQADQPYPTTDPVISYALAGNDLTAADVTLAAVYSDALGHTAAVATDPDACTLTLPYAGPCTLLVTATTPTAPAITYCLRLCRTTFNGSGTPDAPFTLSTPAELAYLATATLTDGASYLLTRDIDLSEVENWTPIGTEAAPFRGIFDGGGHTISGLKVDTEKDAGLFGYAEQSTFRNLTLVSPRLTATKACGALVGWFIQGTIENCNVKRGECNVGDFGVGGLVGRLTGDCTLTNCHAEEMTLRGGNKVSGYINAAGGLIGYIGPEKGGTLVTLTKCSATRCTITCQKNSCGGLVGYVAGLNVKLNGCYATGTVSCPQWIIGGLIGPLYDATATLNGCYSRCILIVDGTPLGMQGTYSLALTGGGEGYNVKGDAHYYITACDIPADPANPGADYTDSHGTIFRHSLTPDVIRNMNAAAGRQLYGPGGEYND